MAAAKRYELEKGRMVTYRKPANFGDLPSNPTIVRAATQIVDNCRQGSSDNCLGGNFWLKKKETELETHFIESSQEDRRH